MARKFYSEKLGGRFSRNRRPYPSFLSSVEAQTAKARLDDQAFGHVSSKPLFMTFKRSTSR